MIHHGALAAQTLARACLDVVLPGQCLVCGKSASDRICSQCQHELPAIDNPCLLCGAERKAADEPCRHCENAGWPFLASVTSAFPYTDPIRSLITRAKVQGDRAALLACSEYFCKRIPPLQPDTVIIAIPATPGRRPGQHLATALALALQRRDGNQFARKILQQTRRPAAQHDLDERDRRRNVEDLYICTAMAPAS